MPSPLSSPLAACASLNSGEFLTHQTSVSWKLAAVKHVKYEVQVKHVKYEVPVAGVTENKVLVESETCLDYYYED